MSVALSPTAAVGSTAAHPLRFRERARARSGHADVLVFTLGDERFAFDVRALDEALARPVIDPSPASDDPVVAGLARVGTRSMLVYDAGALLGVPRRDEGQLLLLRAGDGRIALLVDDVDDVMVLDFATLQPPPFDTEDELLLGVSWDGGVLTAIVDARALIVACQQRGRAEHGP